MKTILAMALALLIAGCGAFEKQPYQCDFYSGQVVEFKNGQTGIVSSVHGKYGQCGVYVYSYGKEEYFQNDTLRRMVK